MAEMANMSTLFDTASWISVTEDGFTVHYYKARAIIEKLFLYMRGDLESRL